MPEGVLTATGPCWACGGLFTFDPDEVPSIAIDPATQLPPDVGGTPAENGVYQPLCPDCVTAFRIERRRRGLPDPFPHLGPLPAAGTVTTPGSEVPR